MNRRNYHYALPHMHKRPIIDKRCIQRTERVAFRVNITAKMTRHLIAIRDRFAKSNHLDTTGQPIQRRQLRNEKPVHEDDLSHSILHLPARKIRLRNAGSLLSSQVKWDSSERREIRKSPVFIMHAGKSSPAESH